MWEGVRDANGHSLVFLWAQIRAERTLGTSTHPGGACNEDVGVNEAPESVPDQPL